MKYYNITTIKLSNNNTINMGIREEEKSKPIIEVDTKKFLEQNVYIGDSDKPRDFKSYLKTTYYSTCETIDELVKNQGADLVLEPPSITWNRELNSIGFNDGITRVQWLVEHGAESFLAIVSNESYSVLLGKISK